MYYSSKVGLLLVRLFITQQITVFLNWVRSIVLKKAVSTTGGGYCLFILGEPKGGKTSNNKWQSGASCLKRKSGVISIEVYKKDIGIT